MQKDEGDQKGKSARKRKQKNPGKDFRGKKGLCGGVFWG